MVRRQVEVRREEILAATVDQIEKAGLAQTRVSDVATALGVSTALLFYHFGTKDRLLAAAFRHAVERDLARLDKALADGTGPVDRLRRVVRLYGPTGDAVGWRMWIDAWAVALREPAIRRVLRGLDDRWRSVLLSVVEDGVREGAFVADDPVAAVARISAQLDGLSVAALVYRSVTRKQLRDWVVRMVADELGVAQDTLA
jgi:AcrR family transcriptional regulator